MPISAITNRSPAAAARRCFSLIELVVVMAIAAITITIGALAFRPALSADRRADQLARELLAFCAQVRTQAMCAGAERKIVLNREERRLETAETASGDRELESQFVTLRFPLPEGMEIDAGETEQGNEPPELFRFFPDGAGSGRNRLTIRVEQRERTVEISQLTGAVRLAEQKPQ